MKVTVIPIGAITKGLIKGLRNKRISGEHPNDSIIKVSQNTEKSPGDLRSLAFTQTSVEDHQLTLL